MRRRLGFFDILCLGINGIVGSGIFLLPGRLLGGLGPASLLLFVLAGIALTIICLCFAEAASRVDRNGGPYNYVTIAFGPRLGFAVGWFAVVCAIFNYATVAVGLVGYAGTLIPWLTQGWHLQLITGSMILILAVLNIRGVRLGAGTTNLFTVGKIIPLLIFVGLGVFCLKGENFVPFAPHGYGPMSGLLLATLFTYQGFEAAPIPAGEVSNAKRNVPLAMLGSLLISMVLYLLIQTVIVGSGAQIGGSESPLADAAAHVLGPWGGMMITIGALISMSGYVAGSAFLGPRYLGVLCEDGHLPRIGARHHPRHDTPYIGVIVVSLFAFLFTVFLNFDQLVDISAFAVVVQYLFTCLSIPLLRKKIPDTAETFKTPGGWLFPILGVLLCGVFIAQIKIPELMWSVWAVLIGIVISFAYRRLRRS